MEKSKFIEKLTTEMSCAINAIYGDQVKEFDKILEENPKTEIKEIIGPYDLKDIVRKMEWYIFDEVKVFKSNPETKPIEKVK